MPSTTGLIIITSVIMVVEIWLKNKKILNFVMVESNWILQRTQMMYKVAQIEIPHRNLTFNEVITVNDFVEGKSKFNSFNDPFRTIFI